MNAVERIEAAIAKLEVLKGNGPSWVLLGGNEWISPIGITVAPDDGGVSPREAELIVTLHRTIDAQLAILRAGLVQAQSEERYPHYWYAPPKDGTLALADAILGGES